MTPSVTRSEASNEELVRMARRRTPAPELKRAQEAFSQLYLRCAPRMLAYLAGRTSRGDLDDTHSAVWARIWEKLPEKFDGNNFLAWAFKIGTNYLMDQSRRRRPELLAEAAGVVDPDSDTPEGRILAQERGRVLAGCIERLPAELRELVKGRLAGEAYPELARRLGLPAERAHRQFHTAKQLLQDCFTRAGL